MTADNVTSARRLVAGLQDAQQLVLDVGQQMAALRQRVAELESAIIKHRRATEPERCTTCTTDSHQLWQLVDEGKQP